MKYIYATTIGKLPIVEKAVVAQEHSEYFDDNVGDYVDHVEDVVDYVVVGRPDHPIPPDDTDWQLVGCAANDKHQFWYWKKE